MSQEIDFVTAHTPPVQSEADRTVGAMIDAHMRGDRQAAQDLGNRATALYEGQQPQEPWAPAMLQPLPPMEAPPPLEDTAVSHATQVLQGVEGGAEILQEWGADTKQNLEFATAFADHIRTSSPDLYAKLDAALGNDPAMLREAARLGRLVGGFRGTRR